MTQPDQIKLCVLSLGAGVQSTAMALMAAHGEITPMPDCAIFADTGAEPRGVYQHLDWLERELPFPVHRVSAGNLRDQIVGATMGLNRMDARPPFFTASGGMLNRQCTQDFKIRPIERKLRDLVGLKKGQRSPKKQIISLWIGISWDEAMRMKPSRLPFATNRWPLVERQLHRRHCLSWLEKKGYPKPAKSACTFCPYTDNARWRDMKENDPESFAAAGERTRLLRLVEQGMALAHGLMCPPCHSQGVEMAATCCKDSDCDAGWFGIDADAVKAFLDAGEEVMPGTLVRFDAPPADHGNVS